MRKLRRSPSSAIFLLAALCAFSAAPASCDRAVESNKTARPLDIEGHRIGIAASAVKQQLREMNVKDYETDFSDLIVYDPSPDTEIKILFTCSDRGPVVARVDRSRAISGGKKRVCPVAVQE